MSSDDEPRCALCFGPTYEPQDGVVRCAGRSPCPPELVAEIAAYEEAVSTAECGEHNAGKEDIAYRQNCRVCAARRASVEQVARFRAKLRADNFTRTSPATDAGLPAGWDQVDLSDVLDQAEAGELVLPVPDVGVVEGSHAGLFYSAKVNGIAGASGDGKSWIALAVGLQEMRKGRRFIYCDFEDGAATAVLRLLAIGASVDLLRERFHYVAPRRHDRAGIRELVELVGSETSPPFVVLDSTGEAMALAGQHQNDDNATAEWFAVLARPLAEAGATTVLVDHVTKDSDGGLFPSGSQRKRAAVTGVQYVAQSVEPFSREQDGCTALVVAKDRPGARAKGEVASYVRFAHPVESVETIAGHGDGHGHGDGPGIVVTYADRLDIALGPGKTAAEREAEKEVKAAQAIAADVAELDRLDPPPRSQRDVQSRMGWGGSRALKALQAWRESQNAPRSGSATEER